MRFGLKNDTIRAIQEVLAKYPEVEKAILYGSRAKGNYRPGSDIDLTVQGEKLTLTTLQKIENELDDLLLPYKIDLSVLHQIENPDLLAHIERVGQVFHEKEGLMGEWREYKLGDIADIISERVSISNATLHNYISTENMINDFGGVANAEKSPIVPSVNSFIQNDILFSNIRTYFKKVWLSTFNGTVSPDVLVFRARKNKCVSNFLFYLLCTPDFTEYSVLTSKGAKMPRGDKDALQNFSFHLPPLPEQTAIASILSSLDDKIDLLHRQNATLEKMAETIFRQWFVEEAKEEWEIGKIEDLFVLQRGFDLPIQNRINGRYPIIASSGESGFHHEFKVKGPGVITGRSGVLGNVFYVQGDFWPLNTSLFVKEFKNSSPLHSYFVLKNIDLNSFNAGSAVPTLNRNHVHEFPIEIPPMRVIHEYDKIAMPVYKKIKSNQSQIRTLTALRDTLLPKLMSGEIRIVI